MAKKEKIKFELPNHEDTDFSEIIIDKLRDIIREEIGPDDPRIQ